MNIADGARERRALHQEWLSIRKMRPRHRDQCEIGLHARRPSRIIELAVQVEAFPKQWLGPVMITLVQREIADGVERASAVQLGLVPWNDVEQPGKPLARLRDVSTPDPPAKQVGNHSKRVRQLSLD